MSIILLSALLLAALVASAVIVVRWAMARRRPQAGFPLDPAAAPPTRTDRPPR
jgi:hypothetical protein